MENGKLTHYVNIEHLRADPLGLGQLAEQGFEFVKDGTRLTGEVEQLRLYRVGEEPNFATLSEAQAAFSSTQLQPDMSAPLYVGDSVVDVVLRYRSDGWIGSYSLASNLDPGLPGQEDTANLVLDYGQGQPKVFRSRGLLLEPLAIERSVFAPTKTFVVEGIRHILEGLDHVLFVICLVLGAQGLHSLLWRVTGFTLGHSVTLALGFFGFVPAGAWFVPAIETGIALSIVYAATIAILPASRTSPGEKRMFVVTCMIGLLHGLGFSFVLQNILQVTSPNIWQSLFAFNVGVEIGQLAIVLASWPILLLIRFLNVKAWKIIQVCVATVCICIASIWAFQRFYSIFA